MTSAVDESTGHRQNRKQFAWSTVAAISLGLSTCNRHDQSAPTGREPAARVQPTIGQDTSVVEADQVHDVDEEPQQPRKVPGEAEAPQVGDGSRAAEDGQAVARCSVLRSRSD